MITTVVLNPAVDKIFFADNFQVGGLFRIKETIISAGGKGINVSRVIRTLGEEVLALGFKGGHTGEWLVEQLKKLGAMTEFIEVEGESRTNINIIDRINGTETEVLETGPFITEKNIEEFISIYRKALDKTKIVVCSGGIPSGVKDDIYKKLIIEAKKQDIKVILDASGEVLKQGIEAGPYLIKPNLRELGSLVNKELEGIPDVLEACRYIQGEGVELVLASLGEKGAILVTKDRAFRVCVPGIKVVNTIGCGDSMVAGVALVLAKGLDLKEALRLGAACGVNNAQYQGIGVVNRDEVYKLTEEIRIEEI
ncbi:1-phosphofructokinase [Acetivibrio clariflavus]|uniref:Tagatose-6-phosphate kinase n=1 Tax=Acetivibrio clariflavus (strain DSM 19732 / NBRC 101661 / EBR45) TaxID=720554 RepID=G8LTV8_ACECE|nr:1-phosphofructokinase [Acetivibrio clariflavus]AEV67304.1 1-phosphofructokinase [Acetivibrio clariflavus DSM 19732]HOQ00611.1 1-phosphofructokinase [Acetivibrio clariflavus]